MRFELGTYLVEVNRSSQAALLRAVHQRFAAGEGFSVATLNLDHLVKLRTSPQFRVAYTAQDFVVADGNPIVWLSHLANRPVSLVPGSDLVVPLARVAAEAGVAVGLVGSTHDALHAASAVLRAEAPHIAIAEEISPSMVFDPSGPEADAIIARLQAARVGLVFLALGAPKQEILAARGRVLAPEMGFAFIGAGLDFLAGAQMRAPQWVRKLAFEWLWRVASDPRRLALRYLACFGVLPRYTLQALRLRLIDPCPTRAAPPLLVASRGAAASPWVAPDAPVPRLVRPGREALPVATVAPREGILLPRDGAPAAVAARPEWWAEHADAPAGHDDTPRSGPRRASG